MLNDFCLENGGTIPVMYSCAIWHPKTATMSWRSTLRSFISRSLSQEIEQLEDSDYEDHTKTATDALVLARVSADLITVESPRV